MSYALLATCLLSTSVSAEWSSFRGPNGTGIGSGDPPVRWNVETGENVRWKTDVPGLAHSSPILHGGRVFLTTAVSGEAEPSLKVGLYGSGDSPSERGAWSWRVMCLDRATGKVRWQRTAHTGEPKQKRHTKASHANSTPATDGKVIVAMFGSEGMYCYDASGRLKWKVDLGVLRSGPHNAPSMEWGFASSPVIYKDRVIMQCDVLGGGFIAVLDLETGRELRRIPRDDVATWSTPAMCSTGGRTQIVCNGYKHIGAYDLETGAEIWRLRGGGDIPVPVPVVAEGLIFISNAHGRMNPIYAVRPDARGDITPARDAEPPAGLAWWHPRRGSYIPTPIAYEGRLYIGNDRGRVTCLDAKTGQQLYQRRIVEKGRGAYSASPVAAGGKVYFTSERGKIHVLAAGGEFRRLATNDMGEVCMATPAIDRGQLFVRTRRRLYCIAAAARAEARPVRRVRPEPDRHARTDANGRIVALEIEGEPIDIRTNLRIPLAGWRSLPSLDNATGVKRSRTAGKQTWRGQIEVSKGARYRYEQTLGREGDAVRLSYRVTAEADVETEGVFFWLDLPVAVFGGGSCELSRGREVIQRAPMPEEQARPRHFARAEADAVTMTAGPGTPRLRFELDKPCHVTVQDNREWNTPTYSAFVRFPGGALARGQSATLDVVLRLSGEADHSPAVLTLNARAKRYRLDGFGGNYCFGIESPVTRYTLDNLRVAWARTEMTLPEWEPTNDNDSPARTDWTFLRGHDRPGTNLRREFLLAQDIQRRGIPYSITIWHLPEWLYENPRTDGKRPNRRRIHPGKWDELLECIGTYLTHARKEYGVEPDLFSFNEANIGVRVLLTAEEHRAAIKRIGSHLAGLGLKTRMLLADATGPRGTHTYAEPAAGDPEAMRHVGAVGFHSWGGATPGQYRAWADLADRLGLPLLVAELGVDAGAWRGRRYRSFHYGLREVRMYQELLLHARPRGTMQWEFTSDYGIVQTERDDAGREKLVPHVRFWFIKHFCDLTPPDAAALTTESGHAAVLFTAFEGRVEQKTVHTLHIANMAASRPATIRGIPAGINELRAVRTSRNEAFKELGPVVVENGSVRTTLAPQSLLTLTTMP